MTAEVQSPASSAPSPHDSLRVRVRNYDDMVKRFVTFDVQFQPPCLVRWGSEPLQVSFLPCPLNLQVGFSHRGGFDCKLIL